MCLEINFKFINTFSYLNRYAQEREIRFFSIKMENIMFNEIDIIIITAIMIKIVITKIINIMIYYSI